MPDIHERRDRYRGGVDVVQLQADYPQDHCQRASLSLPGDA
jgi:hypothetical protein